MAPKPLLNRRDILKTAGIAGLTGAAIASPMGLIQQGAALAGADAAKPAIMQAPGFFRFKVGEFLVTVVSDGNLVIPSKLFAVNRPEAEVTAFFKANFEDAAESYVHTNACVIDSGTKKIMVDAGSGANFQKTAGRLVDNLKAAGHAPEDIDAIVITHGHPDHIWGIIDDATGKPRFPKAEYFVNTVEWDYWTDEQLASKLPKQYAPMALGARRNLMPISAKTKRIKPGDEIVPGIQIFDTPGHTVGHVSVRAVSGNETLVVTGDVLVNPYISLERPDWHFAYDADPETAVKTRKKLLDMVTTDRMMTVAFHFPFPGVGHIAANGRAYRWVPINWHWQL